MHVTKSHAEIFPAVASVRCRADLVRVMRQLMMLAGADHYALLDTVPARGDAHAQVIASSWPHDAVDMIGVDGFAGLYHGPGAEAPPDRFEPMDVHRIAGSRVADTLSGLGQVELLTSHIYAGLKRGLLVLSSERPGKIDIEALPRIRLLVCHAWSMIATSTQQQPLPNPLSERERECLHWVSQGKTTSEVAVILDVSANTVNRYILHATQKLAASTRTMAIAIAIRSGFV